MKTKSLSTHTPGPWRIEGKWIHSTDTLVSLPINYKTDVVIRNDPDGAGLEEASANARLIAAAPELLEAAKAASVEINWEKKLILQLLDTAIAKAEGRG